MCIAYIIQCILINVFRPLAVHVFQRQSTGCNEPPLGTVFRAASDPNQALREILRAALDSLNLHQKDESPQMERRGIIVYSHK